MLKVLLPAAGFGTRVNADYVNGKELLTDPNTGLPLIQWSIEMARIAKADPLVISRRTKVGLNAEMERQGIPCLKVEESALKEWPDTIILSEQHWERKNLMLLPDTRFPDAQDYIRLVERFLKHSDVVFLTIPLAEQDASKFAIYDYMTDWICEKPSEGVESRAQIICAIGFNNAVGRKLFEGLSKRGEWFSIPKATISHIQIPWFKDITRSGNVEQYS